jgi:hypothetical protein
MIGVGFREFLYDSDGDLTVMKEIDADTAAMLARSYFEKYGEKGRDSGKERASDRIVADWREVTIASVKGGRKDFTVQCELYEEPSSTTRTKHTLKISKTGEILKVDNENR